VSYDTLGVRKQAEENIILQKQVIKISLCPRNKKPS
jgi:hypothetical protein